MKVELPPDLLNAIARRAGTDIRTARNYFSHCEHQTRPATRAALDRALADELDARKRAEARKLEALALASPLELEAS